MTSTSNPMRTLGVPGAWDGRPLHALSGQDVAEALGTVRERGLPSEEAARRLRQHGPNRIPEPPAPSRVAVLLRQLRNAMVALLALAGLVSLLVGEALDAAVILAIVVANAVLGYLQEQRAEQATAALRRLVSPTARVLRDGEVREIAAEAVTVGDIALLGAGDRAPADGRLVHADALEIDESALTGESLPVAKRAEPPADADAALAERTSMAHAGSMATRGSARLLVTAVGAGTEVGRIAAGIGGEEPRTPLQARLDRFSGQLLRAAFAVCLLLAGISLVHREPLGQSILVGVSLAVAAVPEGLPAVVTVTLALGMRRMAEHGAIVRRLHAVETLGSTTVLCTDKTGTLTENRMRVVRALRTGVGELPADDHASEALRELLTAALTASEDLGDLDDGLPARAEPMEVAIAQAAAACGVAQARLRAQQPVLAVRPFDSERKRMSVVIAREDGRRTAYVKGAPELMLALLAPGALDPALASAAEAWAAEGIRVLLVARRSDLPDGGDPEGDLEPLGLVGLADPPRTTARTSVETARAAGVTTIMITGDHPATALAIARATAIADEHHGEVLTGADLDRLAPEELAPSLERVRVVARVAPAHKVDIVRALRERGDVVAMTGDGVNDVPALSAAHIGVAMGQRGTDAAVAAADMVLTDDDISTIVRAIERGRSIYDNILRFVQFLLSANAGEVLVFTLAVTLGLGAPLGVLQVLVLNLLTDGLPALALGSDPPEPGIMRRRPRPLGESLLRPIAGRLALGGVATGAAGFAAYVAGLQTGAAHGRTMAYVTLVLAQLLYVYAVRGEGAAWRAGRNRALHVAVLASLAIWAATLVVTPVADRLGIVELTAGQLALAVALATIPFVATELHKASRRSQR